LYLQRRYVSLIIVFSIEYQWFSE